MKKRPNFPLARRLCGYALRSQKGRSADHTNTSLPLNLARRDVRLLDEAFQLGALGCVHRAFDDALLAQPSVNDSRDASNNFATHSKAALLATKDETSKVLSLRRKARSLLA